MKNDSEFLVGVYEKAKIFSSGEVRPRGFDEPKPNHFKRYIGIAAAAVLIAVIAPSLYFSFNASHEMFEPVEQNAQRAAEPSAAALAVATVDIDETIKLCDLVVTANVKKIDKSVYGDSDTSHMTTTVTLKVARTFKGKSESVIKLKVNGGYDPKTSNFIPYEATFKKKENVLLFLVQTTDGEYTLQNSAYGKYSEVKDQEASDVYIAKDGATITIEEVSDRTSRLG